MVLGVYWVERGGGYGGGGALADQWERRKKRIKSGDAHPPTSYRPGKLPDK